MPKRPNRPSLRLDDDEGRRLEAVWSRSGKRLGVAVTTARYHPYAQVGLSAEQVEAFARFLTESQIQAFDANDAEMRFDDPDEQGELRAMWNRRRKRLHMTAAPLRGIPAHGDWREHSALVELRDGQVDAVASFLKECPATDP